MFDYFGNRSEMSKWWPFDVLDNSGRSAKIANYFGNLSEMSGRLAFDILLVILVCRKCLRYQKLRLFKNPKKLRYSKIKWNGYSFHRFSHTIWSLMDPFDGHGRF